MAEFAGLAFGVAGILVPAYQGYQKCSTVIADAKNFPRKFRAFKLTLKTQRDIFSGECELLLKGFVDSSVLQEMLRDQGHEKWEDAGFQTAFCGHLAIGGSLEDKLVPFGVVREALDEIMKEVSEFEEKINVGHGITTSTRIITLAEEASQRFRRIGHSVDWALWKKTRLADLVETLRKQNGALFQLRNQAEAKAGLQYIPQQNKVLERNTTSLFSEYLVIQDVSMKLHKALAGTATCHCHIVNLRLDSEPRDSERPKFRFVLTEDPGVCASNQGIFQDRCTYLLVESGRKVVRLSSVDSIGPSTMDLGGPFGSLGTVATTTPQTVLEAIDDLCTFLKKTSDIAIGQSTCLGYMKSDDSYYHMVYKDFPGVLAPISRVSLSSLLSSLNTSEKQKLLPHGDRLKLGLALSLSVLHFGSYTNSWFKKHWRSQDIYFFDDTERRGLLSISSPHVATSFSSCLENEPSDPSAENDDHMDARRTWTTLARNEQLFSLAIVLMEIAYGDLLCNIFESGNKTTGGPKRLDEFAEYLKAKTVSDFIGREMGKKYADVVKRCLYCDFGIDESDLSKRELQEVFFTNVVCKLEQCVKQFSD